ncbi:MAG TPA: PIN domain-containing protein [Candidatus Kapabacteria bacterium]|nr:PIN domain-containing protein [Candidatus Kapabacteria bacterium]
MAIMFLVDTNIFLEILLNQTKKEDCKNFLNNNQGNLLISDFSLHSIGVILFKQKLSNFFNIFLQDITNIIDVISIPLNQLSSVTDASKKFKFDFDDAYQYSIANLYNLEIVTLDSDFNKAKEIKVIFL